MQSTKFGIFAKILFLAINIKHTHRRTAKNLEIPQNVKIYQNLNLKNLNQR